ncbi:kinase-like domain-containing protein [Echria macrotheca]|uniref:EKC/KEOPS complex subunit BUD32 n=1 Tax=Echria macrotheca TaxID=438768 RepID=A0AAJ0B451_9PEZI|nr:kinase-like domain-containing protein [Echria macrotheca]
MAAAPYQDDDAQSFTTVETAEPVFSGDFATLTPDNIAARAAFDGVVAFLEAGTASADPYHAQFLSVNVASEPATADSPSSQTSSPSTPPPPTQGHYRLSLDKLPEGPNASWRIGRGSAHTNGFGNGVDLLLVPPGQHRGQGVANVHALISIHRLSGAFMLRSTSNRPIKYLSAAEDGRDLVLRRGEQTVIYRTENRFRIGELDYILTIDVEHESHFEKIRNEFITSVLAQPSLPHPQLDVIPQPYHQKIAGYIIHKPISSGAFGMVRSAVDSRTGDPVAVKRVSCRSYRDVRAVDTEMRIACRFLPRGGYDENCNIIPLLSQWCEHVSTPPCGRTPEDIFLAMPLARTDFAHLDWSAITMDVRLALFHCTLTGLSRIHASNVMHRDISSKNLLVCSLHPPSAAICDFGKAIDKPYDTETAIGPIDTVAPEVWQATPARPYGPAVDVWSMGYAWLSTFGSLLRFFSAANNRKTDEKRHQRIQLELDERVKAGIIPAALGSLIRSMMEYNPRFRYTAAQALEHPVWISLVTRRSVGSDDGNAAKRARLLSPEADDPPEPPKPPSPLPDTEPN